MQFNFSMNSQHTGKKLTLFTAINFFLLLVAVVAVGDAWGGHFLAYLGAGIIALYLPLIMFPLAIWAVIVAWGWAWYWAFLIFLWPVFLVIFGVGSALVFGKVLMNKMRHKNNARQTNSRHTNPQGGADVEVEAESVDIHDMPDDKR